MAMRSARQAATPTAQQISGAAAEAAAASLLATRGLRVIERNFRAPGGEIDLICQDGATTVFVEVRARKRRDFGSAADSITTAKQQRLILAARHWLARHDPTGRMPCRFDAVLAEGGRLEWLRDAFRPD